METLISIAREAYCDAMRRATVPTEQVFAILFTHGLKISLNRVYVPIAISGFDYTSSALAEEVYADSLKTQRLCKSLYGIKPKLLRMGRYQGRLLGVLQAYSLPEEASIMRRLHRLQTSIIASRVPDGNIRASRECYYAAMLYNPLDVRAHRGWGGCDNIHHDYYNY